MGKSKLVLGILALCASGQAQVTQRVSVSSTGAEGNGHSFLPAISADGRFIAFSSEATNFVQGTPISHYSVFLRDRVAGSTELVSVSSDGTPANSYSQDPSISADGRYIVFYSSASNLAPNDVNGGGDVFIRDRRSGTTALVSFGADGMSAGTPSISADGRYVAFINHLWIQNVPPDVFVLDRLSGTYKRVSGTPTGQQSSDIWGVDASISANGRCVAFTTYANDPTLGDDDGMPDVFVRDRVSGTLECVSVSSSGEKGGRWSWGAELSGDGSLVAYSSLAANLVPGDTNTSTDVFVRDRRSGVTERVSVDSSGIQGNGASYAPTLSGDGRYVAFYSEATNLVPGDTNGGPDVFVHDRTTRLTERINLDPMGNQGTRACYGCIPEISTDGRFVTFDSFAFNLVPGDANAALDVLVREREHADYVGLCEPGVGGVVGCPCSNPPNGAGRGCDNSSSTGGASLSISGGEYLSSDSLVLTTTGATPSALSIVLQGTATIPAGAIHGQGVRCVGGQLRRMYSKLSSGGSITAPSFATGDPMVHERSAALGDVIAAGSTRWYMAFYRDPAVLGGCPASSTFNTTQAREVLWKP